MRSAWFIGFAIVGMGGGLGYSQEFAPGHIFVTEFGGEGCRNPGGPLNWIREIDPDTGESWIFADANDGLCDNTGLIFTPDGRRLRSANWGPQNVLDFDAAGNPEVTFAGIPGVGAYNGMAFDPDGNFYLRNTSVSTILRFPAGGGPPDEFAHWTHLLEARGGLAFDGQGNLFAADDHRIVKFTGRNESTIFDDLGAGPPRSPRFRCVAFDRAGNLYATVDVSGVNDELYRYDEADPQRRRLLANIHRGSYFTLVVAPDQQELYVAGLNYVYAVDVETGALREIHYFDTPPAGSFGGFGIALYTPPAPGDVNCDGVMDAGDIEPFITALLDRAAYESRWPHCDAARADLNGDGAVDAFDIEPFIALLFP